MSSCIFPINYSTYFFYPSYLFNIIIILASVNEDFGFQSNEWITTESPMTNSAVSLGNISCEEEMLMAEAVDVTEATLSDNLFCEETMF